MKVLFDASATRPKADKSAKSAAGPFPGRRHGLLLVVFAGLSGRLKTNRSRMATICVIRRISDANLYFGDSRDCGGCSPALRMHNKHVERRRAPRLRTLG